MMNFGRIAPIAVSLSLVATVAAAADLESCRTVRMSDPGWSDITATNALLGAVLTPLGYEQTVDLLAVPVTFEALKNGQLDVFLGNWMPAQKRFVEPLVDSGELVVLHKNLEGIRFTLAVPSYVAEQGVTSFADLAKHADEFGREIYGIDPGAPANQNIQKMINDKDFGLEDWTLVESSEQAMLLQVERAARSEDWIVFLAWEPHPMNKNMKLTYLAGGDAYFGPNYGAATVYTVTRKGFPEDCPNLVKLLRQVTFDVDLENRIMAAVAEDGVDAMAAAKAELIANPAYLSVWLDGVATTDGEPGLAAVQAALGLQ